MVGPLPDARAIAGAVVDPELPMLTLSDLGVLRDVEVKGGGAVAVSLTPTYSGCPALEVMRRDVELALHRAGYTEVDVRLRLAPPWTTDWLSDAARRKLLAAGIAPPGRAPARTAGPIPLTLGPRAARVPCPRCGSDDTEETSRFSGTACRALWRCRTCAEPFEQVKEI